MTRRLVVTSVIGDLQTALARLTVPTQEAYAAKIGAKHVVINKTLPEYEGKTAHWSKFWIWKLLEDMDEALWLDADIAIKPSAPDIFEVAGGNLAAYPEGDVVERIEQFKRYYKALRGKEFPAGRGCRYFNSGVVVIPKEARNIYKPPILEHVELTARLKREHPESYFYDQNILNVRIMESGIKVVPLINRWNLMHVPGEAAGIDWAKRAEYAHFVHYAGLLHYMGPKVLDVVTEDLGKWGINHGK